MEERPRSTKVRYKNLKVLRSYLKALTLTCVHLADRSGVELAGTPPGVPVTSVATTRRTSNCLFYYFSLNLAFLYIQFCVPLWNIIV
jgi:hypothetical protein